MEKVPVVVFGNGTFSSLAWYCLTHDSNYRVVAFTVDREFVGSGSHQGLPVLPFEDVASFHPPGSVRMLVPLGYRDINGLRRDRYLAAKAMGYEFASYVSSRACTWPDFQIGENCMVYEHAIVQPFARIGDNVIVRSGAHVSHHCEIADHAFLAAGVTLGGNVQVGERAFLGVGAVLRDGLVIAPRSFVGAGAVILADTASDAVYVGNPARKAGTTAQEASR